MKEILPFPNLNISDNSQYEHDKPAERNKDFRW